MKQVEVYKLELKLEAARLDLEKAKERRDDIYWQLVRLNGRCPSCRNDHYPHCGAQ